ncbi:MAG: CinA family nicotinamide mononucleotide deamidase-related protein [Bacteroidales bacterium]|nr:CinA family nicotinamide mononucleotide deamidase-related protein [Bacteroidales bacterium]
MIHASICTIGNEILIGQVVDTNSSRIASALEEAGIRVTRMVSFGDDRDEILNNLRNELTQSDIVITTGGLGPTKDDMTKAVLAELSGSTGYVEHAGQLAIIHDILHSRGLDMLEINRAQALVPDRCEVIENRLGTAPVMVFRFPADSFNATLYALPGVPFEAVGAIPDLMQDIRAHYPLTNILHRSLMVYGLAESALSELIAPWEDALPDEMHLAYLPHPLTGIRLRLSIYGGMHEEQEARVEEQIVRLKEILGNRVYSDQDDTLEATVGRLLKKAGMTLSAAESCTGGEISHLITSVPGASAYYLGSVTSYAVSVKEKVLGVPAETIEKFGVVSGEVAAAMAEGVRKVTGSDYAISTTGLAGPDGDALNPVGTVWIGVAGPNGVKTEKRHFRNDRKRNIQRFSAEALNILRLQILEDLSH